MAEKNLAASLENVAQCGADDSMNLIVTDVSLDVVRRDLESFPKAGGDSHTSAQTYGILRVRTKDGVEGNCIVGERWGRPKSYFEAVINTLKPEIIGRSAIMREWLWNRHKQLRLQFRSVDAAWAAIDIALWDIAGKAAGLPVHQLLGTSRDAVPAYATYSVKGNKAEHFISEANEVIARGFSAYKIHPGATSNRETCRTAELVRKEVGENVALMLDPNGGYDFQKALTVGHALDANGFHWFEDPISYHEADSLAELSRRLNTPLCVSDFAPQQFQQAANHIRNKAARMVRGTALQLGITGLRKICAMAEGFGLNCEIGTGGNPLTNAANLHVAQSVANCGYYEYHIADEAERFGLTSYTEIDDQSMVCAPNRPGLGFELDEDWIGNHMIETLA
ncbi:MAG: enolase C-terminal domain-like protein [Paracoccaceae bacterium]|jgi:L-alanine-DL-glutamate epimerase-like enolase superfamily enzyme